LNYSKQETLFLTVINMARRPHWWCNG
jgi:hypothetical protein